MRLACGRAPFVGEAWRHTWSTAGPAVMDAPEIGRTTPARRDFSTVVDGGVARSRPFYAQPRMG